MDTNFNIGPQQYNSLQYNSPPTDQRNNSIIDRNWTVGSQQFNTTSSTNQGKQQHNGTSNYTSSSFNNNDWNHYGQNLNSNEVQPMYPTFNLSTPTNRWNERWTPQEYVQNSGNQEATGGFNSTTQGNQLHPNYSMGNYYQQDNFRMSGNSGSVNREINGDMYYSSIPQNNQRMPVFQASGLHCNCCSRFVNERLCQNQFTSPHQNNSYWNRTRNIQQQSPSRSQQCLSDDRE